MIVLDTMMEILLSYYCTVNKIKKKNVFKKAAHVSSVHK